MTRSTMKASVVNISLSLLEKIHIRSLANSQHSVTARNRYNNMPEIMDLILKIVALMTLAPISKNKILNNMSLILASYQAWVGLPSS